jgi:hypothetical protein
MSCDPGLMVMSLIPAILGVNQKIELGVFNLASPSEWQVRIQVGAKHRIHDEHQRAYHMYIKQHHVYWVVRDDIESVGRSQSI